jgi:DNA-binding transcriptional ArsR family regulator
MPERAHVPGDPFAALGDRTRRAILEELAASALTVTELAARLPVSRPAVSKHLNLLRDAGLVAAEQRGGRRVYRLEEDGLAVADDYVRRVWGERMSRFRLYAENTRPAGERSGDRGPEERT